MLQFHTLDVFTDRAFGGNPLAVVLEADALSQNHMQRIAREFNLSETVFVQKPTRPGALVRARIFTPIEELPFAGHPTVGTACLLAELGIAPAGEEIDFVLDEGIGPVAVRVRRSGAAPTYAELSVAQAPSFGSGAPDAEAIAHILGLAPADIGYAQEGPRQVSCGLPFLLVPLRAPELLAGIEVDFLRLAALLKYCDAHSVYVYARGYEQEIRARMFSPGIGEDPATGSGVAALAARLADESDRTDGTLSWTVHQGLEMGRPSRLDIRANKSGGRIAAVRVGGHAVRVMQGRINEI